MLNTWSEPMNYKQGRPNHNSLGPTKVIHHTYPTPATRGESWNTNQIVRKDGYNYTATVS